jgi:hypothetical protein
MDVYYYVGQIVFVRSFVVAFVEACMQGPRPLFNCVFVLCSVASKESSIELNGDHWDGRRSRGGESTTTAGAGN